MLFELFSRSWTQDWKESNITWHFATNHRQQITRWHLPIPYLTPTSNTLTPTTECRITTESKVTNLQTTRFCIFENSSVTSYFLFVCVIRLFWLTVGKYFGIFYLRRFGFTGLFTSDFSTLILSDVTKLDLLQWGLDFCWILLLYCTV